MKKSAVAVALFLLLLPAAVGPIFSYDFFWHRATGRWIVEHRALPLTDPFTAGSYRVEWINGEWLWEAIVYSLHSIPAIVFANAAMVALTFAVAFLASSRNAPWPICLFLTAIAAATAIWYRSLAVRPSTAGASLAVLALVLLDDQRHDWLYLLLAIVWINVHPSALLAPLLALLARRVHWLPIASAAALLINPFGWKAVVAPIHLMSFIRDARGWGFFNLEWLPADVERYPLVYLTLLAGVAAFFFSKKHVSRLAAFALFAVLAMRGTRNVGLYFATMPLLVASMIPSTWSRKWLAAVAVVPIAFVLAAVPHHAELEPSNYPLGAVAQLQQTGLPGNIYSPDRYGGLLDWSFYPSRRALWDGRNELYHDLIPRWVAAQHRNDVWRDLLQRYRIDLAIDERHPMVVDADPATGTLRPRPAPREYWPPSEWALIGQDEMAMVFARRAAFAPETLRRFERPRSGWVGKRDLRSLP